MSLAIDTLQLARSLADAGMERAQAEAISSALARGVRDSDLAMKADVETLRVELKAEVESLRVELKADVEALRVELKADIGALRAEVRSEIDGVRKDGKLESAGLRTEIVQSRNQIILSMIAIAGLALAIIRFLPWR
jgi:uncharacterized protein YjiS (DUF1127 family)